MKRRPRLGLALILTLLLWLPGIACGDSALDPAPLAGTVTWIYDGDTLKIAPHGKVRLIGIDCPEREGSGERDRKFVQLGAHPERLRQIHRKALQFNIALVKGRDVQLLLEGSRRDRHGRLLAYVRLADGRLLNRLLIEEGLAVVYRRFDFSLKADFLVSEATARQNGRGLWQQEVRSENFPGTSLP